MEEDTGDDDDTANDDTDSGDDRHPPGVSCDDLNPAPVEFETHEGTLSAEDFVFTTGGLDGIAGDICENVYVTDFGAGQVFHWRASGEPPEVAATLPDFWIPNMDFRPGTGGLDSDKLGANPRNMGFGHGLDIGIPGRPVAHR